MSWYRQPPNANKDVADFACPDKGSAVQSNAMSNIITIIIGVVLIVCGLSGEFVLRGTDSSVAITVVGVAVTIWGVFRLIQERKKK
jgi:uncharacterized membrane protein HdeD (DUF308 family)